MNCRLCHASLSHRVLQLDNMPLTDEFVPVAAPRAEYIRDISIYRCGACGLVQNPSDFDHAGYYQSYEYSSGHSEFTRSFMRAYAGAACLAFERSTGRAAASVIEVGSGDGEQLKAFIDLGVKNVLGVEPSDALVLQSERIGVPALKGLFSMDTAAQLGTRRFDICLSSYTLDHVRNPVDFLHAAHRLLVDGGVVAFEVHDLARIAERSEWCLFEHEHTIYMDEAMAREVVERNGFDVVAVNPLPETGVRANSLIVLAVKRPVSAAARPLPTAAVAGVDVQQLQARIDATIAGIDRWVNGLPAADRLVGYGAGGRGVMTLAALATHARFAQIFDTNYTSGRLLTPKTHRPVGGLDNVADFRDAWCLVFSFGYFDEIRATLVGKGYDPARIVSLKDFYARA